MTVTKQWSVEVLINENDRNTYAEARLHTGEAAELRGVGAARRNPQDSNVPQIGDEVAAARALADLADALLGAAASDIEAITHQPAHLRGHWRSA